MPRRAKRLRPSDKNGACRVSGPVMRLTHRYVAIEPSRRHGEAGETRRRSILSALSVLVSELRPTSLSRWFAAPHTVAQHSIRVRTVLEVTWQR